THTTGASTIQIGRVMMVAIMKETKSKGFNANKEIIVLEANITISHTSERISRRVEGSGLVVDRFEEKVTLVKLISVVDVRVKVRSVGDDGDDDAKEDEQDLMVSPSS
ncbi:14796_t:CDS:1, partial [Acaulospora colombiana]